MMNTATSMLIAERHHRPNHRGSSSRSPSVIGTNELANPAEPQQVRAALRDGADEPGRGRHGVTATTGAAKKAVVPGGGTRGIPGRRRSTGTPAQPLRSTR